MQRSSGPKISHARRDWSSKLLRILILEYNQSNAHLSFWDTAHLPLPRVNIYPK